MQLYVSILLFSLSFAARPKLFRSVEQEENRFLPANQVFTRLDAMAKDGITVPQALHQLALDSPVETLKQLEAIELAAYQAMVSDMRDWSRVFYGHAVIPSFVEVLAFVERLNNLADRIFEAAPQQASLVNAIRPTGLDSLSTVLDTIDVALRQKDGVAPFRGIHGAYRIGLEPIFIKQLGLRIKSNPRGTMQLVQYVGRMEVAINAATIYASFLQYGNLNEKVKNLVALFERRSEDQKMEAVFLAAQILNSQNAKPYLYSLKRLLMIKFWKALSLPTGQMIPFASRLEALLPSDQKLIGHVLRLKRIIDGEIPRDKIHLPEYSYDHKFMKTEKRLSEDLRECHDETIQDKADALLTQRGYPLEFSFELPVKALLESI